MTLTINVVGTPAPQGSKRGFYNAGLGRVQMVESSKKVKPWRQDVVAAACNATAEQPAAWILDGPLEVTIDFYLARPKGHYGTGRNAGTLKATAPALVDKKPDVDKLVRSTLDGLKESGVYRDDAQVAVLVATKRYADAKTGARISITPLATSGPQTAGMGPSLPVSVMPGAPTQGEGNGRPAPQPEPEGALF